MINKKVALSKYMQEDNSSGIMIGNEDENIQKIIQKAVEYEAPFLKNEELIKEFLNLNIDDKEANPLYESVAEFLSWLKKSEQKAQISS